MDTYEARDTRRKNLTVAVQECGTQAALAKRLSVEASYISQMLNGHRGIGEETARKIERSLRKPRGWLDTPQPEVWGQITVAKAAGNPVLTSSDKTAQRAWLDAEIAKLRPDDLDIILTLVHKLRAREESEDNPA